MMKMTAMADRGLADAVAAVVGRGLASGGGESNASGSRLSLDSTYQRRGSRRVHCSDDDRQTSTVMRVEM